jgi:hypothetical protein
VSCNTVCRNTPSFIIWKSLEKHYKILQRGLIFNSTSFPIIWGACHASLFRINVWTCDLTSITTGVTAWELTQGNYRQISITSSISMVLSWQWLKTRQSDNDSLSFWLTSCSKHINMQYFTTDIFMMYLYTDIAIIKMVVLDDFCTLRIWISGPYGCIYIVQE